MRRKKKMFFSLNEVYLKKIILVLSITNIIKIK